MEKSETCFSGFVALASALTCLIVSAPAFAAATVINFNYFDSANHSNCGGSTNCDAEFTQIPSGKSLLVLRVSCRIIMGASRNIQQFRLIREQVSNGATKGYEHLAIQPSIPAGGGGFQMFLINNETMLAVPEGSKPVVEVSASDGGGSYNVNCTIHGVLNDYTPSAQAH